MTLDAFRAEAAGWLGRTPDGLTCVAWKHEPGSRPTTCPLAEADALSVPRAEYDAAVDDAAAAEAPSWAVTLDADGGDSEPCTLHEVKVVYLLAQKLLGFCGAVQPSASGRSWTLYREA